MEKICTDWKIPFVNLTGIPPEDITAKLQLCNPKIILSSIEDISREEVQSQIQLLNIAYVAIDESQVLLISRSKAWSLYKNKSLSKIVADQRLDQRSKDNNKQIKDQK